jgi:hypothetical protein
MDAAQDEPPRDGHRAALAHGERQAAERRARHLHTDRQPGDPGEQPVRHVDRKHCRDERAEQDERQRLDDDRDEDEDEGLDLGDVADAEGPGYDDNGADEGRAGKDEQRPRRACSDEPGPGPRLDTESLLDRADRPAP